MGLPQFIAFLNQSSESNVSVSSGNSPRVDGSTYARSRAGGDKGSSAGTYTALPRPRNSSSATGNRKSSFSSQLTDSLQTPYSMTPPETPRSGTGPKMISSVDSQHPETSLASIPSNSELSTPDTLRRSENIRNTANGSSVKNGERNPSMMSNSTSKLPKRTTSLREPSNNRTSSTSPRQIRSSAGQQQQRSTSSATTRKPPSHLLSNVEQNHARGTQGTFSSESTIAAAFTTLGNNTSKHGTNSEYILIKPKHGTVINRTVSNIRSFKRK